MKPIKQLTAILLLIVVIFSCQKELSQTNSAQPGLPVNTAKISASVSGKIIDENGKPVQGVTVQSESSFAITNINGEFALKNASLVEQTATVQAIKPGYFTGSRTFVARAGEDHFVEIQLLKKATNGTVTSSAGGSVSLTNGATVTLPATSVVVQSTNAAYAGNIHVAAAWIDPTSPNLYRQMPGDLRGIDNNSAEVGLESYGMMAVELTGDGGEALQIAPGKKAALKFPLPAAIANVAPATIALWSYDENKGLWIQEGTATKNGNFYVADVGHFSFWNCDAPFPVVDFTAVVKDQNNQPLKNVQVRLTFTQAKANTSSGGYTDASGVVKGKIPSNQTLVLEVFSSCNSVMYTQTIGPFTSAANINVTVNVATPQAATIAGSAVNCSNIAVVKGSAELLVGQKIYRTSITNGAFSFTIELCNTTQAATITVTDSASSQQSVSTVTLNTGANNIGSFTACGTSITQFINVTVGGVAYSFVPPADSVTAYIRQGFTNVSGTKMLSNTVQKMYFEFLGTNTGSFPLTSLNISVPGRNSNLVQGAANTVTVTEYGSAGGFIAGSFSCIVSDSTGSGTVTSSPLQCSFRVKRRQ